MERFRAEQVEKIWKRVQSGAAYTPETVSETEDRPALRTGEMIVREQMGEALLLELSRRYSEKNAAVLRQMAKQEKGHRAILRGICVMAEGKPPMIRSLKPESGSTAALLQRCYGHCLQNMLEYERRGSDPQYGGTFQKMAEQEQNHCRILLTLLGSMK